MSLRAVIDLRTPEEIREDLVKRMEHHIQTRGTPSEVFAVPNGEVSEGMFQTAVEIVSRRHGVQAAVRTSGFGNYIAFFPPNT